MKTNNELKDLALESLKGRWGLAIIGFLIYALIVGLPHSLMSGTERLHLYDVSLAFQMIFSSTMIVFFLIGGAFAFGLAVFSLNLARREEPRVEDIFAGFKDFGRAVITYILYSVYVFLWTLLLIIPGIIKSISYSQVFYILVEDDTIGAEEAISKSMAMMKGYKMKYFILTLSFLGWAILCIFTFGIGFLWLVPYINVTYAHFYQEVRDNYEAEQGII